MPGYIPGVTKYEQETKLEDLFGSLGQGFNRLHGLSDAKQQSQLKELTAQMQEAKTLIKEFEREARTDGMPPLDLATRKKALVQELNGYITAKKDFTAASAAKAELTGSDSPRSGKGGGIKAQSDMTTSELMTVGRKQIAETDDALVRAQRVVASTIEVGTKTAETLQAQTQQMERVLDDLDEIKFSLKKASKVMRDITRSLATDKCIMLLMVVTVVGVVVLIGLKAGGVVKKSTNIPVPRIPGLSPTSPSPTTTATPTAPTTSSSTTGGRRLLQMILYE